MNRRVAGDSRLKRYLAIATAALVVIAVVATVSFLELRSGTTRVAADSSVTFAPNPVDFGGQAIGTTSGARTVVVGNRDGSLALSIRSVGISGPDASEFSVDTNICRAVTIPPGQSCSIDLRFTPRVTGTRQATLVVQRGDVPASLTMALAGDGVAQPLGVDQATVDFGQISVNATSAARTVPAKDIGGRPVVMHGVALTGDNSQDFSITASPAGCTGITLQRGDSCSVRVTFTPSDYGDRTANLAYSYDGPGSPLLVALTGVGAALSLKVAPAYIDFGRQQVATASAAMLVTISTPAGTTVTIGTVTVTGLDASYFKLSSDTCTGVTLAPRDSCTVAARFVPYAAGLRGATVAVIRANEVSVVNSVQLNGFGFFPK